MRLAYLLALFLERNIADVMTCEMAIELATRARARPDFVLELGSYNMLAICFQAGEVRIDHDVAALGALRIDAGQFEYLLSRWLRVLRSAVAVESTVKLDLLPAIRRPRRRSVPTSSPAAPAIHCKSHTLDPVSGRPCNPT